MVVSISSVSEIDSFTLKFKNLLANGFKASLLLEADNCDAFVTLKAGLGSSQAVPSPSGYTFDSGINNFSQQLNCKPRTPYYRRQERRKLDREKASGKSKEVDSSSNVVLTDEKEETDSSDVGMNVRDGHDINTAAEIDNDLMYVDVHGIAQNCREAAVEAEISESAVENDSDTPTVVKVGNEESCANVADTHDIVKTTEDTCIEIADVKLPSHEQTVWAQVSLEASQNPTF